MKNKAFALVIAAVMIVAVTATVSAWECDRIEVWGPEDVMVGEPFYICLVVVDEFGEPVTGYDKSVGFDSTDTTAEIKDPDSEEWGSMTGYAYLFKGETDGGEKCFEVKFNDVGVDGTQLISVAGENGAGEIDQFGKIKIAVLVPVSDTIGVTTEVVPPIDFRVAPLSLIFKQRLGAGGIPSDPELVTMYNWGSKDLLITAEVIGEPFEESVWLNNVEEGLTYWEEWEFEFLHNDYYQAEETTDVVLQIPVMFGGSGEYTGEVIFWAERLPSQRPTPTPTHPPL